mmetsp:Transcript_872/g.2762  ORF Transcript_872/g.2762 Transcript_872/m.2762 type:complete len:210 (+) Transcript_872:1188-1817(+)
MLVAVLDLRQDLPLPENQRVQPGAHLEDMVNRVLAGVREQVLVQLLPRQAGFAHEEGLHALQCGMAVELLGCEVQLEAVAGRQDRHLGDQGAAGARRPGELDKLLGVAIPIRLLHSELLPNFDRSLVMAQADDMHLHHGLRRSWRNHSRRRLRGSLVDPVADEFLAAIFALDASNILEVCPQLGAPDAHGGVAEIVDLGVQLLEDGVEL